MGEYTDFFVIIGLFATICVCIYIMIILGMFLKVSFKIGDENKFFVKKMKEPLKYSFVDNSILLKREVKEQIIRELESTRYVNCPYPQCDEMYHAWNEAFDAMEKVVKQLLDNDLA